MKKENEELRKEKNSLTDKISKRLLELKFGKHNSIKSKCLKWINLMFNCVVCRSNKSRFLKQKHRNKKHFNTLLTNVIKIR